MTCILIVLKYVFPFRFSCTPNYPEMTRHNPCKRVITDKFMVKITKNAQSSLQVAYKTRHLGGPYHVVPCINLQSTVRLEIFEVIIVRNLCRDHNKYIVTQKMFSLFVIATRTSKNTRWRTKKV
jgi:hypothetical protein